MYEIESRLLTETPTLVMWTKTGVEGIPAFQSKAFAEVARHIENTDARLAGPAFARYRPIEPGGEIEIEAGFPLVDAVEGAGEVVASTLPGGDAAVTMHIGRYDAMEPAYVAINAWIRAHEGRPNGPAWEVYFTDPMAEPDPSTWRTEIVQPFVKND